MRAVLAGALAALAVPALVAMAAPAAAQDHAHHGRMGAPVEGALLTVSADGEVAGAPDQAVVSLGVQTDGPTAEAAMRANAQRMSALMTALRRAGVAERDVQTSGLSVNPQYVYQENAPPRISGYMANNQVSARVRDLDRLGRTLDEAIAAGGNTLNGVTFGLQNPDAALDQARQAAIAEVRARANLYAEALGMRVHRLISISEGGGYAPAPMPMMMQARMSADMAPTPVAPGEVTTQVMVNAVFELR